MVATAACLEYPMRIQHRRKPVNLESSSWCSDSSACNSVRNGTAVPGALLPTLVEDRHARIQAVTELVQRR